MNKGYKILLTASLLSGFADSLIGSFYAIFVQKIGGSILEIGYSMTIFSISAGILIILVGKISDKISKKYITVCGYLLFALGNFGFLFIKHPYQLFILQIVFALGVACLSGPMSSLFSQYIQKKNDGFQWSLGSGSSRIVTGLSVLTGTFILKYTGFKTLFLIMGILGLVATSIQMSLKEEDKQEK
jgi:MFS family permease